MSDYLYKDSGVAWIGQIPEHWDTIKIKYTSWLKGRIGWQGLTSDEYQDEGAYLITGTDFNEGRINWDTCVHISEERFAEDEDIHIKEGDLLITKDGTIGKVAVAKDCPNQVSLNSGVMLIRNTGDFKYYDQYLYYTLLSDEFWNWYEMSQTGASTIRHLYQEQFYNFEFAYPSMEEQIKIADYLDKKIGGINESIKELEKTIEEYKSWKQALILKSVTKGLQESCSYIDSGETWIGEIPKGWKVARLHIICDLLTGGTPSTSNEEWFDGELQWFTPGDFNELYDLSSSKRTLSVKAKEDGVAKIVKGNSVLVVGIGATAGKIGFVKDECSFNQQVTAVIPKSENIDSRYLMYAMIPAAVYLKGTLMYTTLPIINNQSLGELKIAFPSIDEQKNIANFLDKKCTDIEVLIKEKEDLISELMQYKKSLIFEVVTGKRKVV